MELRRRMMGKSGGSIPYQRIEYLESNGRQSIDTGIKHDFSNKYEIICNILYTNGSLQLNGWDAGGAFGTNASKAYDGTYALGPENITNKYVFLELVINALSNSRTETTITVDNVTYSSSRAHSALHTYAGNSGFILFACFSQNIVKYNCRERLYDCKIYQNDILVRDFVPVRIEQVGYLYDRVSGELFGNAGPWNFVLGSDVN